MKNIAVIGSGFAGLSAASYLAKYGYKVQIFEKNNDLGGRARKFTTHNGFSFDMGPSWYWMPEVFERYFADFNASTADFYTLIKLNPAFEMVLSNQTKLQIPANYQDLLQLFESVEKGSSLALQRFMNSAEKKYNIAFQDLIFSPGLSWLEFCKISIFKNLFTLDIFSSYSTYVKKYFKNPILIALMEFPILFLGAMPQDTPALYSLMNYAGLKLGTYYPLGGFSKIIEGMVSINKKLQVEIFTNAAIQKLHVSKNKIVAITVNNAEVACDGVIATADYHHVENCLLENKYRNYSNDYWDKKTFAPSCLIYYLGVNKKIDNLLHHTLFFENDLQEHAKDIYINKQWSKKPLFYVCCTSKTDPNVAPVGQENIFMLMPIAIGLEDSETTRELFFNEMLQRLEKHVNISIKNNIVYKKSYCVSDFIFDYNAYKGNGYGLANTVLQTAVFKPSMQNKKIKNLFYAGQLTVPGPGVPPCIISGKIVANLINKQINKNIL